MGKKEDKCLGILICGNGIGISIAANKNKGIRCALCNNQYMAKMARKHNDANILALDGRVIGNELAKDIVEIFLNNTFENGRHINRINKIE
jgi:ribose 5-phosphate isomerase B